MKKAILRVLLLIFGLNVFTACYGMPPEDWQDLPSLEEQAKASVPSDEDDTEELDELETEETDYMP